MNQIWPRVFQRIHRTAVLPMRSHSGCAEPTAVPASTSSRHIRPTLLVSRLYQPASLRDMQQDTLLKGEMTCKSQRLMQKAGLIHPSNPGCYYYLPATVRSMEKLVRRAFKELLCQVSMVTTNQYFDKKYSLKRFFWHESVTRIGQEK